jgi:hypothetical protein
MQCAPSPTRAENASSSTSGQSQSAFDHHRCLSRPQGDPGDRQRVCRGDPGHRPARRDSGGWTAGAGRHRVSKESGDEPLLMRLAQVCHGGASPGPAVVYRTEPFLKPPRSTPGSPASATSSGSTSSLALVPKATRRASAARCTPAACPATRSSSPPSSILRGRTPRPRRSGAWNGWAGAQPNARGLQPARHRPASLGRACAADRRADGAHASPSTSALVPAAGSRRHHEIDPPRPNRGERRSSFALSDEDLSALDALDETGGTERALERPWW